MDLRYLVKLKRPLAKELRRQEDETGMSLEQKSFDALHFNLDYLSELASAGLAAAMIADEYQKLNERNYDTSG